MMKTSESPLALVMIALSLLGVLPDARAQDAGKTASAETSSSEEPNVATFGGGCFWCTEAVFENVEGVTDVVSGFSGGQFPNPSYQQVLTGRTGHAEVCQITFDPKRTSYLKLLEVFLRTHDPTTVNKQGPDFGTQYRSIILTHSDAQRKEAETLIDKLNKEKAFRSKIVTQVVPFVSFYAAEEYHQDYYRKHPEAAYCKSYIPPKLAKLRKVVKEMEKE